MSYQPSDILRWMPFAAALAAWAAAFFAYLTARRSGRALRLAEQQEERRRPALRIYLQTGYARRTNDGRIYMFLLSVSNPSDSNNAVVRIDLRIEYRTSSNFLAAVDVVAVSQHDGMLEADERSGLKFPTNIDAHQSVAGWVFFRLHNDLFRDCLTDAYVIVATDSHGERASVETSLVQELVDEAEIKKG